MPADPLPVLLDPALGLDPAALAAAWNAHPPAAALAQARLQPAAAKSFDPSLVELVLLPLLVGLTTNALYDILKLLLAEQGVTREIQIVEHTAPDGSQVRIITIKR
jgi:hypothetical protein